MARRRRSTAIVRTITPQVIRTPAPIIRVSAPRAVAKKKHRSRRSSSGGASLNTKNMLAAGIGGAVLGFVEKTFPNLPTVPLIGRKGTIALAAYFLSRRGGIGHGGIIRDVGLAAAAIAGYELGKEGRVTGEIMGEVVPQVSGIAAQV